MENYGCWKDKSLSEHLKCVVKQGKTSVTGKLPEGYVVSLSHKWVSPFAEDSPGSVFPKTGAALQAMTGKTMKGYVNSMLSWENSEPQSLSLPLSFSAFKDPEKEVDMAVRMLMAMSSPRFSQDVKEVAENPSLSSLWTLIKSKISSPFDIGDRIPQSAQVAIGRKFILNNCVIDSVEVNDPMIKTKDGFSLKMSVNLNIRTRYTQDIVDILNKNYR